MTAAGSFASVVVQRRVEWHDTDASGHHHFSVVQRWAEIAEAVLMERLGLTGLFGRTPRVHYEAEFASRLWLGDRVEIELAVTNVGRSSLHYGFTVTHAGERAAGGTMTVVLTGSGTTGAVPWPEQSRRALESAGPQRPELLSCGPVPS